MLFASLEFASLLFATVALYWATRSLRLRLGGLLIASFIFYGYRHAPSLALLGGTIVVNYAAGRALERWRSRKLLGAAVVLNLAVLAWFKVSAAFATESPWLPLGISFFTFQVVGYLVDVARGDVPAERSLLTFAVFKSFFAQLVAGPIVRARDMLPQLHAVARFNARQFHQGLFLLLSGLFLKVAVADTLAQFADRAFAAPQAQSTVGAWLSLYAYSVQLLADFWGYSTMAVGMGALFGLVLPVNFETPYLARSLQDFWRRWHITLSGWFRDYLYVPLGGNRRHPHRNLFVVMVLAGLWHGVGLTFLAWGALHGLWLLVERAWTSHKGATTALPAWLSNVLVFHGVALLWVLFNAKDLATALAFYDRLLLPPYTGESAIPALWLVCLIGFALFHHRLDGLMKKERFTKIPLRWQLALSLAMVLAVLGHGGARLDFKYFVF